jgi:hypothetical protein
VADFHFERVTRTPYSESYTIEGDEGTVGRIDLHFTNGPAYGTLCVGENFTEDEIQELVGAIDEKLVMTADQYREDFVVNVWAGRAGGTYSDLEEDEEDEDEEDLDEEEEESGNGRLP